MSPPLRQEPYDAHAAGYQEHLDPTLARAAERLVELAGARRGTRLLDLATGTGTVARAAVRRGASVIGVDRSAGMLAVARELSPEIDLRLADARALPFDPDTFDAVTCGLSLSHFADRENALREVLRVLRAGGVLVASAWGEGSSFPTRAVGELLDRHVAETGTLEEGTWLSPDCGSSELRRVGFASVSVTSESFTGTFADIDEAVSWFVAWPLTASRLARLDPIARERFFCDAHKALSGSDLSWRFVFNFYLATKPASP
jgi:SAM-dependent methyltransferase